ncbi:Acetyl-coenzyme A synthetase, partial [Frankliniella fusca]
RFARSTVGRYRGGGSRFREPAAQESRVPRILCGPFADCEQPTRRIRGPRPSPAEDPRFARYPHGATRRPRALPRTRGLLPRNREPPPR